MLIMKIEPYESGCRPPVQLWNLDTPPEGYAMCTQDQSDVFYSTNPGGFVDITTKENEDGILVVDTIKVNEKALEAYKDTLPDPLPGAKDSQIQNIKQACEEYIFAGADVMYKDGTTEHFSYNLVDQSNISEMFTAILSGASEFPYHADGDICKIYTKEQIISIYGTLSMFKAEATTYHNSLKAQIKAMDNINDVRSVVFHETELKGEYLKNYTEMMASAKEQLEAVLAKVSG